MQEQIHEAMKILERGETFVMPTETVYGLAADASNENAIKKIYSIKNRPQINPLISHYAEISEIEKDVILDSRARKVLEHFCPGPITLVLKKTKNSRISRIVTANLDTAAVRIPDHKIALEILRGFKKPVAAPSANTSGKLSPTKKEHVENDLGKLVSLIIDGGDSQVGLESTILDLSTDKAIVLRFGVVTSQDLQELLSEEIYLKDADGKIKAPGMLLKHYAPQTKLKLNTSEPSSTNQALIAFGEDFNPEGFKEVYNLSHNGDLNEAAQNLFKAIHQLDNNAHDLISVMPIPNEGIGLAINDRLERAAK